MKLTEEQLRIVQHDGGHARVSAVAGSGKTTTMIARIGHLLQQGAVPERMMVLMFNKSARDSFALTMESRLGDSADRLPEVRTFHSLGLRLAKSFTKRGALPGYRLITEDYVQEKLARQVAGEVFREENENEGWLAGEDIEEFITFIDRVKSTVSPAAEVFMSLNLSSRYKYFIRSYELFEEVRKKQGIRFYADLIHEPLMAMLENDELLAWVSNRVEHIIVDEYQDINEAQQQLLKILAGDSAQVMVVGDVDQCIYEWRGAKPEYITSRFRTDFLNPVNYLLSYTFRYGHQISLAANHLILNNRKRDRKFCLSYETTGNTEILCVEEVARHPVLDVLTEWSKQGRTLEEAAVLVRLFAQSVPVELALLEAGVPYRLNGNAHVFDCSEVQALTGYLQLVRGTLVDEEQERREEMVLAMLSQPHLGIKREAMQLISRNIAVHPQSARELLFNLAKEELPPFIRKRIEETAENWRWLMDSSPSGSAAKLLKRIVEKIKLYDFYHNLSARSATAENRVKTCQAFIDFAAGQNLSVSELLDKISDFRSTAYVQNDDALLITSIHRAKGLEWPLVFLPGLEEGSFPFYRERDGGVDDLEDERRLFYVAMTRASEQVICVHPPDAGLKHCILKCCSKAPGNNIRASRFLYELNPGLSSSLGDMIYRDASDSTITADDTVIAKQYLQHVGATVQITEERGEQIAEELPPQEILEIHELAEGLRVKHSAFGSGTVVAVKDRKQGRLVVSFDEHGEVILLATYAKLRPDHHAHGD